MNFLNSIQKRLNLVKILINSDQKDIDRLFTRVFINEDGQKVLAYLHHITTNRVSDAKATEEELRHLQGQRTLIQIIEKLTNRGRNI